MKRILFLLIITAFTNAARAQKTARVNPGLEFNLPVGTYSDVYKPAPGLSLKLEIPAAKNVYVTLSAGYINYSFTHTFKQQLLAIGSTQSSAGFVPIKIGGKYYFNSRFFGEAQLGIAAARAKGAGTSFIYAPGIGCLLGNRLEAGLRYEAWTKSGSTFGQMALRVGVLF